MTDDDKALVERLRTNQCADNMGCNPLAPYCQCAFMDDAADRIEALSAENERLLDIDEVKANVIDSLLNNLASAEQENERLREALALCAKHVDWMPHPHCVDVEAAIRAALGEMK